MSTSSPSAIRYTPLGFNLWRGDLVPMPSAHRHDEIELGVLSRGANVLLFGGDRLDIPAGQLTVFWGAIPHQVIAVSGQPYVYSLTLPLAWVLAWNLPAPFIHSLLCGRVIQTPRADRHGDPIAAMERWAADLARRSREDEEIVLLELQARLRRLAQRPSPPHPPPGPSRGLDPVARIAAHIARHYRDPFEAAFYGRASGLHPRSAMRLFRRACGATLLEHVTFHRIAHAQRLLATTSAKIIDIAQEAGFASASRFYKAFHQVCGQTPTAFRRSARLPPPSRPPRRSILTPPSRSGG